MKKRRRITKVPSTYTLLQEMAASPTEPLPEGLRRHQLTRMWGGLANLERAPAPSTDDWRVCSDAVNLMETLVEMNVVEDASGLLLDAVEALANAGKRHMEGKALRLDAIGIVTVRAVLEDYAAVIEVLPARTVVRCHRLTEKRIRAIWEGKLQPHDVDIVRI
jgi:hypothetical protein